ncbi:MAG: right-handed parallel beta-helix repeat-containing protein [Gammaproteobacteria bacterium]|nr:right-handed parallel beta-helix repeat-containing protein [Gammaproteobacteria bacterium]
MKLIIPLLLITSLLSVKTAVADQAGRKHAENELHARPAVRITVGVRDADIVGSDNFVRRNTIVGNKRGGVYWRNETEPMAVHRVTFENNIVRDNEGWGLFVDGATRGTIIRSNVIEDTGAGRQKTAIRLGKQVGDVTLEDNQVKADKPLFDERAKK